MHYRAAGCTCVFDYCISTLCRHTRMYVNKVPQLYVVTAAYWHTVPLQVLFLQIRYAHIDGEFN